MRARTVWLRRDPVGAYTRLPPREEFRARFARHSLLVGILGVAALAALVALRSQERLERAWSPLWVAVFWLGVTGVAAAAVAFRTPRLRRRASGGLALSLAALVGGLFSETLANSLA